MYIPYPWKGQTGFLNFVLPAIKRELSIPHTHTHIHSERERETERQRQTETKTERQNQRQRDRDRVRERQRFHIYHAQPLLRAAFPHPSIHTVYHHLAIVFSHLRPLLYLPKTFTFQPLSLRFPSQYQY